MIHDDPQRPGPGRHGRRRPGRRRFLRTIHGPAARRTRSLIGLVAGLTLLLSAPLAALAMPTPEPAGGVVGPQPYCARDYERLHGDHYIAYNDDFGSYTCLQTRNQDRSANFTVTSWDQGNDRVGAFPNIFAGWEYGRHPQRSWNPIADDADGSPEVDVNFTHVPGGDYNAAWDIWFNRTDPSNPATLGQNDGTEVMIWLVNHTYFHPAATVWIQNRPWQVMSWIAINRNGVRWRYIAFIAPADLSHATLWLNTFFDEATALGDLNPRWYLTSVAFGYELAFGDFNGLTVNDFAVNYVGQPGYGPDQHNPKTEPNTEPKPKPKNSSPKLRHGERYIKKQSRPKPGPNPELRPVPESKPRSTLKPQSKPGPIVAKQPLGTPL